MTGVFEAGGSKTEFIFGDATASSSGQAAGIHPMFMSEEAISGVLTGLTANFPAGSLKQIFFYGASCGSHELSGKVSTVLARMFPEAVVQVESDLLGTARALCGNSPGFASILGTGANACIFNGKEITRRMVSFGFWLGDEGSGGHLGKKVFRAWLKGELPAAFSEEAEFLFEAPSAKALQFLLEADAPNARMARLGGMAIRNKQLPVFKALIQEGLQDFFRENSDLISEAGQLPFHFSGSVAFHLRDEISATLSVMNLKPGRFADRTTERLFQYHLSI